MIFILLTNAFEAVTKMDEENRKITLNAFKKSKNIFIEFINSCAGIPKDIQDKIMQPFFTTKEIGTATGLGVSISKGIVEDHGGTITLNEDFPTKFTVTLAIEQS